MSEEKPQAEAPAQAEQPKAKAPAKKKPAAKPAQAKSQNPNIARVTNKVVVVNS